MADLSILIPARREMFLARTIEDVLANIYGDTEIIAILDGEWADPPIPDHPRVRLVYLPTAIGQRAATNLAARISTARFVMKLDAHCAVAPGFDLALMQTDAEIDRPDLTQIPMMYNLHAFNWRCQTCGRETYQGPRPASCVAHADRDRELDTVPPPCGVADGFERVMVWKPRHRRASGNGSEGRGALALTEFWRFDADLHFQYKGPRHPGEPEDAEIADVMSSVGACFFMRRARFLELGGLDEEHGSWGQFGTEIACKSWLSGGRHVVNRRTWFAHLFRTQGAAFGFPYPQSSSAQEYAKAYSRNLWLGNHWRPQTRPLAWLLDHFAPVKGWHGDPVGKHTLELVEATGRRFEERRHSPENPTAGLVYYSDCQPDPQLLETVRAQLRRCAGDRPIVSVTLEPVPDFGENIVLDAERGQLTMFRQILAGLEYLDTEIVFFVEHDVIYHPSHFAFVPPTRDRFFYNQNTWKVDATSGQALHYRCCQTSGLCADRRLLVEHYRRRVALIERDGWSRNLGYEPGTNARSRAIDGVGFDVWLSPVPNLDIRHGANLTRSRWRQSEFRNKNSCLGWTMGDAVPGWGRTKGRFEAVLESVREGTTP